MLVFKSSFKGWLAPCRHCLANLQSICRPPLLADWHDAYTGYKLCALLLCPGYMFPFEPMTLGCNNIFSCQPVVHNHGCNQKGHFVGHSWLRSHSGQEHIATDSCTAHQAAAGQCTHEPNASSKTRSGIRPPGQRHALQARMHCWAPFVHARAHAPLASDAVMSFQRH